MKHTRTCLLLALAASLVAPAVVYPVLLMKLLCFALLACAFNLLLGYGGLLSLGHAAFFGGAGYCAGYALKHWGVTAEVALLLGLSVAALLGWAIGSLALRRQGIYFAMITLALAQLVYFLVLQQPGLGGEDGLQSIPRSRLFGLIDLADDRALYYTFLAVFVGACHVIHRTVHSPFGQVLVAVRDNEARAISLGYDVVRVKKLAFVLSAALAGLAGAMKALLFGVVTLADVHWHLSGSVVLMALLGGMGTVFGPAVGACLVVLLENELGDIGAWFAAVTGWSGFGRLGDSVSIVTGLVFMLCVLLFRRGVVGEWLAWLERRRSRPGHAAAREAQGGA
ncbi:leucine/isoleucine/valine transporter permease subunit [Delftia tsuruhatensis]|uniref:branched-chain amino acid ABC transporter permease n=1 Tax=Delftia tsuruhatensis TaxID=180282 RepID=UPI001E790E2E|nr:branched-chain amino acid ABC transporter permease [Delftia tsuruhatensis]CAB5695162.1 leucine/isoleucine/valine transporter permease subunit [Delftia tsuruhatensis]CAC9686990.1 leucine/isoleucine/valine transporter permease subunit [Delftia tsuruhatensis]